MERAHGLPTASRQVRASARGTVFRDVLYAAYGVVVELDGRVDHSFLADRARDLERETPALSGLPHGGRRRQSEDEMAQGPGR